MLGNYIMDVSKNVQTVQEHINKTTRDFRDAHIDIGHTRTPSALGRCMASLSHFLEWCSRNLHWDKQQLQHHQRAAYEAILAVANTQAQYLQAADPCEAFVESINLMISAHIGHLRTKGGGIPSKPETLGWTREESTGDLPTFKSHGKCIGWVDWDVRRNLHRCHIGVERHPQARQQSNHVHTGNDAQATERRRPAASHGR